MAISNNLNESIQLLGTFLQADKNQEMQREQMSFQANQQAIQNRQQQLMTLIQNAREDKRIASERDFNVRQMLAQLGQTAYDSDSKNMLEKISGSLNEQASSADEIANKYEELYNKNLNVLSAYSSGSQFAQGLSISQMNELLNSKNKEIYIKQKFDSELERFHSEPKERRAFISGLISSVNESSLIDLQTKKQNIELMKEQIKSSVSNRLMNQFSMNTNALEIKRSIVKEMDNILDEVSQSVMVSNQYGGQFEQARINAIEDDDLRKKEQQKFDSKQEQLLNDAQQVGVRFTSETDYFMKNTNEYADRIQNYYIDIAEKIGSNPKDFVREYKSIINELDEKLSKNKSINNILLSENNLEKRAKIIALLMNRSLGLSSMDSFQTAKMLVKSENVKEEFLKKTKDNKLKSFEGIEQFANSFSTALYDAYSEIDSDINPKNLTNFIFNNKQEVEKSYEKNKDYSVSLLPKSSLADYKKAKSVLNSLIKKLEKIEKENNKPISKQDFIQNEILSGTLSYYDKSELGSLKKFKKINSLPIKIRINDIKRQIKMYEEVNNIKN